MAFCPEVGKQYRVLPFTPDNDGWTGRIVTVIRVDYLPGTQEMYDVRDMNGEEASFWAADLEEV